MAPNALRKLAVRDIRFAHVKLKSGFGWFIWHRYGVIRASEKKQDSKIKTYYDMNYCWISYCHKPCTLALQEFSGDLCDFAQGH